jgi:hypothetical protein
MTQCLKTKGFKKYAQNITKNQKINIMSAFKMEICFFISVHKIKL